MLNLRGDIDNRFFGNVIWLLRNMAGPQHDASQPKLPERLTGKNAQIECKLVLAFFLHVDGGPATASAEVFVMVVHVMSFLNHELEDIEL
jgi:hypothetical protein